MAYITIKIMQLSLDCNAWLIWFIVNSINYIREILHYTYILFDKFKDLI